MKTMVESDKQRETYVAPSLEHLFPLPQSKNAICFFVANTQKRINKFAMVAWLGYMENHNSEPFDEDSLICVKIFHQLEKEWQQAGSMQGVSFRRLSIFAQNLFVTGARKFYFLKKAIQKKKLYITGVMFTEREMGDCVNNGDSEMKKLPGGCGCPPLKEGTMFVFKPYLKRGEAYGPPSDKIGRNKKLRHFHDPVKKLCHLKKVPFLFLIISDWRLVSFWPSCHDFRISEAWPIENRVACKKMCVRSKWRALSVQNSRSKK